MAKKLRFFIAENQEGGMANMKKQADTIGKIEEAMRLQIEKQIPVFEELEAAQQMKTTQGETVLKANPAMQEIRALFKDYCYVAKVQQELGDTADAEKVKSISDFRAKYKIAK